MKKIKKALACVFALSLILAGCKDDDGNDSQSGNNDGQPVEWTEYLKVSVDPDRFNVGEQEKFQFSLTGISYKPGDVITFQFIPTTGTTDICFRNPSPTEKFFDHTVLPVEIGETSEGASWTNESTGKTFTNVITKVDEFWYRAEIKAQYAGSSGFGFTFYLDDYPTGSEIVYIKNLVVGKQAYDSELFKAQCQVEDYASAPAGIKGDYVTEIVLAPAPVEKVTLTFDSGVEEIKAEKGTVIQQPEDPERIGYTFGGWYNGEELFDFTAPVNESADLTAKWDIVTYTITYNLADGVSNSENNPASYTIESNVTLEAASKEGENFVKWVDAKGNTITVLMGLAGDLELTPVFEPEQGGTDGNEGQDPSEPQEPDSTPEE